MTDKHTTPNENPSTADTSTDSAAGSSTENASADQPTPEQPSAHRHTPAELGGVHTPAKHGDGGQHPAHGAKPSAVPKATDDPARWGRVDDDGTVFVKTADGERAVGSWQAGQPEEGLAHFALRFDDLRTEVELLHARLTGGNADPKQVISTAKQLRESVADAAVVGDLDALAARLDQVIADAEHAKTESKRAREQARTQAADRKRALVEEAEKIADEATQWKAAGDRLRAILDEWKTIKGVDRKTDDALWKQFTKARESFNRRRGAHFAELDKQRVAAKARKQELIAEAEKLASSDDWGPTAAAFRKLMADWKAAGKASKDAEDQLWQRFRAAQDEFFSRRSKVFDERDAEFAENATKKEQLLAEAEKIDTSGGAKAARNALHKIQQRWDAIGKVPRDRIRELEDKFKAVEDRIRSAADSHWRRTDPEAQARADQFRERVRQFEQQAAKARAAGNERRAKEAEQQAAQWREWLAAAEQAVATR